MFDITELYNALQTLKLYFQTNFPYKQTTWPGTADPSDIDGVGHAGAVGDYLLDNSTTPPTRYEKFGAGDHDWQRTVDTGAKALEAIGTVSSEPTGFVDIDQSTISFNEGTRTFSIEQTDDGIPAVYYQNGKKYQITNAVSVVIPNTTGTYLIYFIDGVLTVDAYLADLSLFQGCAFVALICWDSVAGSATIFGEERHGLMPWQVHEYLHSTEGTRYQSGFGVTYTLAGDGTSNSHAQIALADGVIRDEDLEHSIIHSPTPEARFEQVLTPAANLPVFYKNGVNGGWKKTVATAYPLSMGTTYPQYNELVSESWTRTELTNNHYVSMWIFATNDVRHPVVAVLGQSTTNNLNQHLAANKFENLDLTGFPTPEARLLYRVTFRARSLATNSVKAIISDVTDFRTVATISALGATQPTASLVAISPIAGVTSTHVQGALEEIKDLAGGASGFSYQYVDADFSPSTGVVYKVDSSSVGTRLLCNLPVTFSGNFDCFIYDAATTFGTKPCRLLPPGEATYKVAGLAVGESLDLNIDRFGCRLVWCSQTNNLIVSRA